MKRYIIEAIEKLGRKIDRTNELLDILIKKVARSSNPPQAWLPHKKITEAEKLRKENPEAYDYTIEVLKLFF